MVKAKPGLSEQETEQYEGFQNTRKENGHLTDSERTLLTQLQNKMNEAKESKSNTAAGAGSEEKKSGGSGSGGALG